ncbi:MAG: MAPEG family protein [Nannocystaceae bacterium]
MTVELTAVAANAALLILLVLTQQLHHDVRKGIPWTLGNREDQELDPAAERIARTIRNHVEGTAMFTPIALAVVLGQHGSSTTATAATAFVVFRACYAGSYIAGIPYLRSVLWTGALICTCAVGWPLIGG